MARACFAKVLRNVTESTLLNTPQCPGAKWALGVLAFTDFWDPRSMARARFTEVPRNVTASNVFSTLERAVAPCCGMGTRCNGFYIFLESTDQFQENVKAVTPSAHSASGCHRTFQGVGNSGCCNASEHLRKTCTRHGSRLAKQCENNYTKCPLCIRVLRGVGNRRFCNVSEHFCKTYTRHEPRAAKQCKSDDTK